MSVQRKKCYSSNLEIDDDDDANVLYKNFVSFLKFQNAFLQAYKMHKLI